MTRVDHSLQCARCLAELRGFGATDTCPICGLGVAVSLRNAAEALAGRAATRLQVDITCAYCGYNLRTLRIGANCPECGKPVTSTLDRPQSGRCSFGIATACVGFLTPIAAGALLGFDVVHLGPCGGAGGPAVLLLAAALTPMAFILGTIMSALCRARGPLLANVVGLTGCISLAVWLIIAQF
ncbi:MAG TPA: hypothetical protein VGM03_20755 [Phycisphaerae bacterium]|jgi:endogenous inhibitor of DNA gyrase (YacG/DUF329 family)